MPSTILGKRTRRAAAASSPMPPASRSNAIDIRSKDAVSTRASKRRIVINQPNDNDENENPFISHQSDVEVSDAEEETAKPAKRARTTRVAPGKQGASFRSQVEISPAKKINSHFSKVTKASAVEVYQDSKLSTRDAPSTPRHRDAQRGQKVAVTPRHRALLASGVQRTPGAPRTPSSPSTSSTAVYNQARQLFSRCSAPGRLVGRDAERQELSGFVDRCVASKAAGCLYVSGPPGTGKSALVDEVCERYKEDGNVKVATVNCMSVRNAKELATKLQEDLDLSEGFGFDYLQQCFVRGNKARDTQKYLVILDEVDRLVDLDLELLYSLFEWSLSPSSRLILLGIANALDLTDRFLPRLKARNLKPELLPFMPYSASQIAEVLTAKVKSLAPNGESAMPFLHPPAIQFCAKKVAAQTGDLRKAFDICKRAIDLVEAEVREGDAEAASQSSPTKTPLMENINLSSPVTPMTPRSPAKSPLKPRTAADQREVLTRREIYTLDTAPKVTIAHMAKITALVFGNGTTQRLATLNLQQKAVLCTLAAQEKHKASTQVEKTVFATPSKHSQAAPTIKDLYTKYQDLCGRERLLHPLSGGEFRDVVSGLETLGLISPADSKNGSGFGAGGPVTPSRTPSRGGRGKGGFGFGSVAATTGDERRVASTVGMKELEGALEGPAGELMRDLLAGA